MNLMEHSVNPKTILALEDGDGFATLLVDAQVILDSAWMLNVVNDNTGGFWAHITTRDDVDRSALLLDGIFSRYVNNCCHNLGCFAVVDYIVDGQVVKMKDYGWDDGSYGMTFRVYCGSTVDSIVQLQNTLMNNATANSPLVVVAFDSSAEWGFTAVKVS